eukprot:766517-Hanusia_phi.AAC.3
MAVSYSGKSLQTENLVPVHMISSFQGSGAKRVIIKAVPVNGAGRAPIGLVQQYGRAGMSPQTSEG